MLRFFLLTLTLYYLNRIPSGCTALAPECIGACGKEEVCFTTPECVYVSIKKMLKSIHVCTSIFMFIAIQRKNKAFVVFLLSSRTWLSIDFQALFRNLILLFRLFVVHKVARFNLAAIVLNSSLRFQLFAKI